jgi:hypothetical protein
LLDDDAFPLFDDEDFLSFLIFPSFGLGFFGYNKMPQRLCSFNSQRHLGFGGMNIGGRLGDGIEYPWG